MLCQNTNSSTPTVRCDELGSGADAKNSDGRDRQEQQDRRHRFRFGPSLVGALPLFKQSGRSIPALATSDGNSLGCFWTEVQKDNPDFKLFTVSTENDNVRLAVQWAVAAATGGKPPEEVFKGPVFENSVTGKPHPVQCRKDLPGQIYLSAQLSPDDQAKAVSTKYSVACPGG